MLKQRFSAGDRLSGPAAVGALLACFAVVLSPSFVASLILIAEKPWGVASLAPTAAVKPVFPVRHELSEDMRTETAHVSPAQSPDEAAGGALFPSIALRSTELPNIEPAAANEVSSVANREAVEAVVPAALITESAAPERDFRQARHVREIQERLVQLGIYRRSRRAFGKPSRRLTNLIPTPTGTLRPSEAFSPPQWCPPPASSESGARMQAPAPRGSIERVSCLL